MDKEGPLVWKKKEKWLPVVLLLEAGVLSILLKDDLISTFPINEGIFTLFKIKSKEFSVDGPSLEGSLFAMEVKCHSESFLFGDANRKVIDEWINALRSVLTGYRTSKDKPKESTKEKDSTREREPRDPTKERDKDKTKGDKLRRRSGSSPTHSGTIGRASSKERFPFPISLSLRAPNLICLSKNYKPQPRPSMSLLSNRQHRARNPKLQLQRLQNPATHLPPQRIPTITIF